MLTSSIDLTAGGLYIVLLLWNASQLYCFLILAPVHKTAPRIHPRLIRPISLIALASPPLVVLFGLLSMPWSEVARIWQESAAGTPGITVLLALGLILTLMAWGSQWQLALPERLWNGDYFSRSGRRQLLLAGALRTLGIAPIVILTVLLYSAGQVRVIMG